MTLILGFLLSHWRIVALGLLLAGAAIAIPIAKHHYDEERRDEGRSEVQTEWDADKAKQAAVVAANLATKRATDQRTAAREKQRAAELAQAKAELATRATQLQSEVAVYVPPESDARCTIPVGFVGLWNRAAALANGDEPDSEAPNPRSDNLGRPAGVALSQVADAAAAAAFRDATLAQKLDVCRDHVRDVQKWYAEWTSQLQGATP